MNDAALRFLADESCDFGVVRALRAEGYDEQGDEIRTAFVVIQPGHIRMSRNK